MLLDRNARPIKSGDVILLVEVGSIVYVHHVAPLARSWEFSVCRSLVSWNPTQTFWRFDLGQRSIIINTLDAATYYEILYNHYDRVVQ